MYVCTRQNKTRADTPCLECPPLVLYLLLLRVRLRHSLTQNLYSLAILSANDVDTASGLVELATRQVIDVFD